MHVHADDSPHDDHASESGAAGVGVGEAVDAPPGAFAAVKSRGVGGGHMIHQHSIW